MARGSKFRREGVNVFKDGEYYCACRDEVAAATAVDALMRAQGIIPKEPGK